MNQQTSSFTTHHACKKKCLVCDIIQKGIHHSDPDMIDVTAQKQVCTAWNVVYGINCTVCDKMVYVWGNVKVRKDRLKEHEADVRRRCDKPVAEHFNSEGHNVANMGASILEMIRDSSKYYRRVRELNWV